MTLPSPLIGILGGMGPQAGIDLAGKLIAMTRASCDQDHIPFVLLSLPGSVADRTDFLLGKSNVNPAQAIADQFASLSDMGVSIAAMACNTAHASPIFDVTLDLLRSRGVELRILHLIGETVNQIRLTDPAISRVGILGTQGTYRSRLYDKALKDAGLEIVLPQADVREHDIHAALYSPLFGIKTNPAGITQEASARVEAAMTHVRKLGAQAVILGCTELPLAFGEDRFEGMPVLDPARIIAAKLIQETYPDRLDKTA